MAGGPVHILVWTLTWWFSPSLVLFVFLVCTNPFILQVPRRFYKYSLYREKWFCWLSFFFHLGCLERRKRYLKNLDILLKYTCINVNQGVFKNRCYCFVIVIALSSDFTFLPSSLQTTIHNLRHVWWESVIYVFLISESFTVKRLISE